MWQLMLLIAILVMFRLCSLFETPQLFVQEVHLWYVTQKGKVWFGTFLVKQPQKRPTWQFDLPRMMEHFFTPDIEKEVPTGCI